MSDVSAAGGSFNIGEVIATGLRMMGRDWIKLSAITLLPWLTVGGILVAIGLTVAAPGGVPAESMTATVIVLALSAVIALTYFVCQAALTYGVVELLRGRSCSFGRAMAVGLSRLGRLFGIGILLTAILIGFAIASTIVAALLPSPLAVIAASALFLVGGAMLACAFFVLLPVAAIERHNAPRCFTRSRFLTRGYRWPIFGLVLALTIGHTVPDLLAVWFLDAVLPLPVAVLADLLVHACLTTLVAVIIAVAYFRLRYLKEGLDLDEIAGVFD